MASTRTTTTMITTSKKMLGNFFDNGLYSDVSLRCGKDEIACHRVVLAHRSAYFEALFRFGHSLACPQQLTIGLVQQITRVLLCPEVGGASSYQATSCHARATLIYWPRPRMGLGSLGFFRLSLPRSRHDY